MDAKKIKPASNAHAKAHDEIRELLSRIDHIAKTQLVGTDDSTDVLTAIAETTHGLANQLLQNAGTAKGSYTDPAVQAQFLEGVLTSIPSLVAYIDRNYIYQYVNAGYERWFGTTREFCLGRTMAEVIGQAAVDAVRSNFDAALRGETQDFERFMNYRTGGARHIRVKYIPDIDRNGSVKGIISIVSDITTLKEQEKTYRFLRETMNDGFVLQNPRGEITQFNAAALEVLALTEDELFGRTSRDPSWKATRQDNSPFPGDEHPAMVALKSGRPVSGVIMGLKLPSGAKKWIRINAQPFSGPKIDGTGLDGVPLDRWVTCTFSDVTDMVATQSKMAEFFDASLDLIVIANTDGSLKTVNSTFKNVLGYTDAEIASNGFMNFIHPDDVDATLKVVASLAEGVQVVKFENRYRTKSGEYRQISWNCQPNIETGDLYATGRDVTAFRESEASFREVFDHVPVGIIKLDSKFRFLSVNPAYANMLGYTVEEILTMTMTQLTHPDDRVASTNVAVHVRDNGTDVKRFEKRYLHKSGRIVWARITAHRLDHDISQEKRTLSVVEDITTARAIERELIAARDQAIASGLAKTQFLANMSHEIRTPLNGILGNLELLQGESLLPEQRKCSDDALASGRILLDLLNDILNFSKINAGQTALDPAPFEWRSVFEGIEKTYGSVFREKGVQLELITEPSVPAWLLGDSLRLRQIVNNLVSNALKFTEKGKVSVHAAMGASDYLHIMIKDTGIGISTENIGKLFTPFTQADSSTTRRFGGTGLGLSISRELSRLMGGDISIESADGVGTTFTVCVKLPACGAPDGSITGAATTAGEPVRPMHILVAEDNLINQGLTRRILEKAGHTVVIASNGDEALQAMTKSTFDVILMDCQMPVMDGFEATSRIIALYGDKRPPIIALTANAFKEDEERCLAVGMDHYLSKPLAKKQLDAILCKIAARTGT